MTDGKTAEDRAVRSNASAFIFSFLLVCDLLQGKHRRLLQQAYHRSDPGFANKHHESKEALKSIDGVKDENLKGDVSTSIGPVEEKRDDVSQPGETENEEQFENDPEHLSTSS